MIRVLVVDDHELVRAGICRLLENDDDITVVAQASSGSEAIELCAHHNPDVVVLDYGLPDLNAPAVIERLMGFQPSARVLVLTTDTDKDRAIRVLRAGAAGSVAKVSDVSEFLHAVHKVARDGIFASPANIEGIVQQVIHDRVDEPESALSNRELQVIVGLARGMTTRGVAASLRVKPKTAETYRTRILTKLGVSLDS